MVDLKTLEQIAKLANIELESSEKKRLLGELGQITKYFEKLGELDTSTVEPMTRASFSRPSLRQDEVRAFANKKALLEGAPDSDGNLFKVPPVV